MQLGLIANVCSAKPAFIRAKWSKGALQCNAAAVIFAHNHPSGVAEPSSADQVLTQSLKQALAMVDFKVLDHFIVAGSAALSFADRGLI